MYLLTFGPVVSAHISREPIVAGHLKEHRPLPHRRIRSQNRGALAAAFRYKEARRIQATVNGCMPYMVGRWTNQGADQSGGTTEANTSVEKLAMKRADYINHVVIDEVYP